MTPPSVVTLGETMGLLRSTSIGSLEHVSELALQVGGAESNVAIGVVRLGGRATWMGRVGDDAIGRRVLRELRAEGVETTVRVDARARTGIMLKETPTAGSTRVLYYRSGSAGSRLSPDDLDVAAITSAAMVHVTGITPALSESAAAAAVNTAIDLAVDAGVPVSFDVNHRASLWADEAFRSVYRAIAKRADVIFAGADEAELLVGEGSPDELAGLLSDLGPSQAIVKLGSEGCVARIDGEVLSAPARQITPVDTVGAGDAFVAGYLSALLSGKTPIDRLALATTCGAFACLGPGDWESFPRTADLAAPTLGDPVIR
jgi:2-dehydro-3-deoxygluconokinase